MGMKPPVRDSFANIANTINSPKETSNYGEVANAGAGTSMKPTSDPAPANAGAGTTTKGPVPGA
jgi:hypothetical protein